MLGPWRQQNEYVNFVLTALTELAASDPERIIEYQEVISKMLILDLDPVKKIIKPLYSSTGRPALNQQELFRSFILQSGLKLTITEFHAKLLTNHVIRTIAGFTRGSVPGIGTFYDFMSRLYPIDDAPIIRSPYPKLKEKLKKGEKLPPKNPQITATLADMIINSQTHFESLIKRRQERYLQKIFACVSLSKSVELGIIPTTFSTSGDGTCIATGACKQGKKVCKCKENGIFKCTCDRKYTDPNANWGWDSHNEKFYYGYSGYFLSTYCRELKNDLPVHLKLVQANRHDSIPTFFALAEFKELNPNLHIDTFISDSASDNYGTYNVLNHWGINAVIALNPANEGNNKYPAALNIDENGVPVCPGGNKMVYYGFCAKDRFRLKWRCPRVMKKVAPCAACQECSPSPYGRVIYTKPAWDPRIFTKIPRGSQLWKSKMKERTAAERIYDRILQDYRMENTRVRSKKSFFSYLIAAAMNIHLDVQLKYMIQHGMFNLYELIGINTTQQAA
jgi:hypothetical protein